MPKLKNSDNISGYALHAVLVKKDMGLDEAKKVAKDIIKKNKFFHRETKNEYRFRNIPKTKFEKTTFRSKKINPDVTLVLGKLKPEHMHLEGEGLGDWFKKGYEAVKTGVNKVKDFFKPRLDGFNNTSQKTINEYGNQRINNMYLMRTPIQSMLNQALDVISMGKWSELKNKYNYDKLYHLSLVCEVGFKKIIVEKNATVNVNTNFKHSSESEIQNIPLDGRTFTIYDMLEKTRKAVGDTTFFKYSPFNENGGTNCQLFLKLVLQNNNLLTPQAEKFLYQDIDELKKELSGTTKGIAQAVTDIGAIADKVTGGEMKKKKKDMLTEAQVRKIISKRLKEILKEYK